MSRFVTYSVVGLMSLFGGLALAQSPEPIQVDIGAQPVGDALNQFAEQSGLQVVLYADDAKGIDVAGVSGEFDDASVALDSLLASTGLEYSFINDRTVAVASVQKVAEEGGDSESGNRRTAGATPRSVMMAQASAEQSQTSRRTETESDEDEKERPLEEIIVTGTLIRGTSASIGSQLITINQEDIERGGFGNIQEVMHSLPNVFAGGISETSFSRENGVSNVSGATSINLRGLGVGGTLTLLNGRRLAPGGLSGDFVDVSNIPVSLVDRIDILPDGASATYGSDAIVGVVNFILRDDLDGAETGVRFGAGTEGDSNEFRFSQIFGNSWKSGHVQVAYEYYTRDRLRFSDRTFTADADLTALGGDNFRSDSSVPGNTLDPVTGQPAFAIPDGQDGTSLTPADLIDLSPITGDPDAINLFNQNIGKTLLFEQERHTVFASVSQEMGQRCRGQFS